MGGLYDLTPSQQNIYMLVTFSFHKEIVNVPASFAVNRDLDFDLLTKALNLEFERNDALRLRFTKTDGKIQQYFVDEFRMQSVPVLHFGSAEEEEKFFRKDAAAPIRFLKDETFRIYFYTAANGNRGVYFNCTHLALDAIGIMIFFMDLMGVYRALYNRSALPEPLYSFEDYIVKELARANDPGRLQKGEAFYKAYFAEGGEPFYAGVHGNQLLEKERKKTGDPDLRVTKAAYAPQNDKADETQYLIPKEDGEKIFAFCRENNVAPESLFMLGIRTYLSAINYRTEDVFMNLMCGKRISYKDKRTCGCMAQTLQVRTIIPETATFKEGLDEFLRVRTQLFRHLSYPFVNARGMLMKMYGHSATQGVSSCMFSWLPIPPLDFGDVSVDFRTYTPGRYFNPMYAVCYPDPKTGGIMMYYMYRRKIVTEADVKRLHENMVKIILKGIEDPGVRISELLDLVE